MSAISDYKGLIIPNRYSVIIILSFFMGYLALYLGGVNTQFMEPILTHALSALLVFFVTFIMFALNVWGAGDSKLSLAFALWVGLKGVVSFIFIMTIFGGVLGLLALIIKKKNLFKGAAKGSWPDRVNNGENAVPYGIAISFGALISFWQLGYFHVLF
jgi:prepilin peptidase CpaA